MNRARLPIAGSTVLVTGGAGFIGSHLVDRLIVEGAGSVIVVDNLFLGDEGNLAPALASGKVVFYREDIEFATSLDYIFRAHAVDVVFNCATKALNYSFVNPANAFATNVNGVLNLLELQRAGRFRTLCHFSTSEVYGSAVYEPMDESHPRNPTTAYAAGKAAADMAVDSYVRMFDIDAFIVRPFNNYGPRQNYRGPLAAVIPLTAWRLLNGLKPEIHGSGRQTRDFIYVGDTVDAVVKLYGAMAAGDDVNVSTDNQVRVADLIHRICGHFGYDGEVVHSDARRSDVKCHKASNAKVRSLIEYQLTPLEAGLAATLNWYREELAPTEARR